jgi:WD40 repeat protein
MNANLNIISIIITNFQFDKIFNLKHTNKNSYITNLFLIESNNQKKLFNFNKNTQIKVIHFISYIIELFNKMIAISEIIITIWDPKNYFSKVGVLEGHTYKVQCLRQLESKELISSSHDTIRIWDISSLTCMKVINLTIAVYCMITIKENIIAYASANNSLIIYDLVKSTQIVKNRHSKLIKEIFKVSNGDLLTSGWDNIVCLWDSNYGFINVISADKKLSCFVQNGEKIFCYEGKGIYCININKSYQISIFLSLDCWVYRMIMLKDLRLVVRCNNQGGKVKIISLLDKSVIELSVECSIFDTMIQLSDCRLAICSFDIINLLSY